MSTTTLINQNVKPVAYDYNSTPIHVISTANYEEKTFSTTPPTLQLSQGSNTSIEMTWSSDDIYIIEKIFLEWVATNADATNAPTFKNAFQTLSSFKCWVNGSEKVYLQDQQQIQAKVCHYLEQFERPYNQMCDIRDEVGQTLAGETIPVSGTKNFELNLFWLVPELKKMVVNGSGIYKVKFDIVFSQNTNSPVTNGYFVTSNTTSNAYSTNLTYSQIQIRQCLTRHTDARMYKTLQPSSMVCNKFDTVMRAGISWNVPTTDQVTINLSNDLTKRDRILGLRCWLFNNSGSTAYNSASNCKMFSGPSVIAYKVKSRSNIILDHSHPTNDLTHRRRYYQEYIKKRYQQDVPIELLNDSTDLGKFYMMQTYIDLSNVENDEDAISYGGRGNQVNDIEITFYCASALSTNCNLYVMPEYQEIAYIDSKNKSLKYV